MQRCKHEFPFEYFLSLDYQGRYQALEINRGIFEEITRAKSVLSGALAIERKFDILLFNYADFENALSEGGSLIEQYEPGDLWVSHELHRLFGVRVTNLLSSARLFIDSSKSDIKMCTQDFESAQSFIEREFSKHYDDKEGYRLMEALRNYAQHKNVPITNIKVHRSVTGLKGQSKEIKLFVRRDELLKERKIKKNVIREYDSDIEITEAIDEYVGSLCAVNDSVRTYSEEIVHESRIMLDGWIKKYSKLEKRYMGHGLRAIHRSPIGEVVNIRVDTKWDDVRQKLSQTNPDEYIAKRLLPKSVCA